MIDEFELINYEPLFGEKYYKCQLGSNLDHFVSTQYSGDVAEILHNKILSYCKKFNMMHYAVLKAKHEKQKFELSQNMDIPCLFGEDETKILFYLEATILFARSALDIAAYVYSKIILDKRTDSFNDFTKAICKSSIKAINPLKSLIGFLSEENLSAFRLLCGQEKGRALRDIIVHQSTINIQYQEFKNDSEKEKLYVVVNNHLLDYDTFLSILQYEVIAMCSAFEFWIIENIKKVQAVKKTEDITE